MKRTLYLAPFCIRSSIIFVIIFVIIAIISLFRSIVYFYTFVLLAVHLFGRPFVRLSVRLFIRLFIRLFVSLIVRSFLYYVCFDKFNRIDSFLLTVHSFVRSYVYPSFSFVYSAVQSSVHQFFHSFVSSIVHSSYKILSFVRFSVHLFGRQFSLYMHAHIRLFVRPFIRLLFNSIASSFIRNYYTIKLIKKHIRNSHMPVSISSIVHISFFDCPFVLIVCSSRSSVRSIVYFIY